MNSLEQLTVLKGNSCCILGSAENGTQWGVLTADYLLHKLLFSEKYKLVLCLNFDRKVSEFAHIKEKDIISRTRKECVESNDKFNLMEDTDFYNNKSQMKLSEVFESIKLKIATCQHSSFAVFVYSLSEVILNVGASNAIFFMKRLGNLLSSAGTKTDTNQVSCIVFVVHESLHSPEVLAQIQSAVTAVVRVVPNRGTLSPEVAAEIQTIRKSPHTGKVVECTELAIFRDGFLCPMHNTRHNSAVVKSDISDSVATDNELTNGDNSHNLLTKLLTDEGNSSKSSEGQSPLPASSLLAPRLITFDSTDPEFDEDSDPDADLDL